VAEPLDHEPPARVGQGLEDPVQIGQLVNHALEYAPARGQQSSDYFSIEPLLGDHDAAAHRQGDHEIIVVGRPDFSAERVTACGSELTVAIRSRSRLWAVISP
jgi:hypothetical protein